jgi:hypothetical protein
MNEEHEKPREQLSSLAGLDETPHPAFGHLLPWEKAVIAMGAGGAGT